jgi:hypothetical protein
MALSRKVSIIFAVIILFVISINTVFLSTETFRSYVPMSQMPQMPQIPQTQLPENERSHEAGHHNPNHHATNSIDDAIAQALKTNPNCTGKERYLKTILSAADSDSGKNKTILHKFCDSLPTEEQVFERYGSEPVVLGMETCKAYRELLKPENNNGTQMDPMPRVAGLYHTGTNALHKSFTHNIRNISADYDVPVSRRQKHTEIVVTN